MKKSYILAFLTIIIWSTMPTVSKLLLGQLDSYTLLSLSTLLAGVIMFIVNICFKKWSIIKSYSIKDYAKMAAISLPGVFFYYAFYYAGAAILSASQAFIINYLWPVMSIIFACLILKEKMTVRKIVAVALSFLGVFTVAGNDLISFNAQSIKGMLLCFLAAVSYGLYTALNKKSSFDKQVSITVSMFVTGLLSLIIAFVRGENIFIQPAQLLGLLWNGLFTMAVANLLWMLALQAGNTAKISNLAYITPFLSLVWTFLILREPIKPLSIIGLCIIVVGIFIQLKDTKKAVT